MQYSKKLTVLEITWPNDTASFISHQIELYWNYIGRMIRQFYSDLSEPSLAPFETFLESVFLWPQFSNTSSHEKMKIITIFVFALIFSFSATDAKDRKSRGREGKCKVFLQIHYITISKEGHLYFICFSVFSLFNIVQFKNEGCRSSSTLSRWKTFKNILRF